MKRESSLHLLASSLGVKSAETKLRERKKRKKYEEIVENEKNLPK